MFSYKWPKIKVTSNSLLLPLCVVVATSLPFYIVLRLYPTLLNFDLHDEGKNVIFVSCFFLIVFFGSSFAFLFNDLFIGPFFTILGVLVAECATLITTMVFKTSSPSRNGIIISLAFFGLTTGILHTCITAFFGDRHTDELFYGRLKHFHFYLLGQFVAYFFSIILVPLYYPTENYGICHSSICRVVPLFIAIACIGLSFCLLLLFYFRTLRNSSSKSNAMPAPFNRMILALIIFMPFLFFWTLTFLAEQFWIFQAQNMYTQLQTNHLELIRVVILMLCIPIAFWISFGGNEFLRMTVGGILIFISVIYSNFLGNFHVQPHRNITGPNLTELYACNMHQRICHYIISELEIYVPNHHCVGPFLIGSPLLDFDTPIITDDYDVYNINDEFKESKVSTIVLIPSMDGNLLNLMVFPERNFRSLSTLPLIRVISYRLADGETASVCIVGGEPIIKLNISTDDLHIMEVPPGEYNVSFCNDSSVMRTFYFRRGGYYNILLNLVNMCDSMMVITAVVRIPGYELSIYYQAIQYFLLSLGKILILSSGLEISYALVEGDIKCSIIGIFWGIYYLAHVTYYSMYNFLENNFLNDISSIYVYMMASIGLFYLLYYFAAYKLTEIKFTLDGDARSTLDVDKENENKLDEQILALDVLEQNETSGEEQNEISGQEQNETELRKVVALPDRTFDGRNLKEKKPIAKLLPEDNDNGYSTINGHKKHEIKKLPRDSRYIITFDGRRLRKDAPKEEYKIEFEESIPEIEIEPKPTKKVEKRIPRWGHKKESEHTNMKMERGKNDFDETKPKTESDKKEFEEPKLRRDNHKIESDDIPPKLKRDDRDFEEPKPRREKHKKQSDDTKHKMERDKHEFEELKPRREIHKTPSDDKKLKLERDKNNFEETKPKTERDKNEFEEPKPKREKHKIESEDMPPKLERDDRDFEEPKPRREKHKKDSEDAKHKIERDKQEFEEPKPRREIHKTPSEDKKLKIERDEKKHRGSRQKDQTKTEKGGKALTSNVTKFKSSDSSSD